MTVDVQRDFLDYLNTFGTLIAAALAAFAVWQASRSSRKALEGISRERRIDFELDRLIELQDALSNARSEQYGRNATIAMSLRLLPPGDLPLVRETFLPTNPPDKPLIRQLGVTQQPGLPLEESTARDGRTLREHMIDAVNAAIQRRVNERGD